MSNFDTIDQIFQQSIDLISQMLNILAEKNNYFQSYKYQMNETKMDYLKITTNILIDNRAHSLLQNDQTKLLLSFYNEIDRIGLPNKINDIIDVINNSLSDKELVCISTQLSKFNKLPKYETFERPTEEIMKCKNCTELMTINQSTNEFECVCGIVKNLEGSAYEEQSFIDGQLSSMHKTNYIKAGHTLKWLMQSQARENFDFPDGSVATKPNVKLEILKQFQIDSITDKRQVNCAVMRRCLKTLELTEYNSHIPLLIKETTGKMPFQLSQVEFDNIIDDAVQILEIIGELEDGNSPYHPFLLLKIIEQKLPEKSRLDKYRKANIILYFHIQTENTLKEKDQLWHIICEHMPGYTYQATNIDKYKLWL